MDQNVIKRLCVYNPLNSPVFLEGLEFLILPGGYVDLYSLYNEEEIKESQSLSLALDSGLLMIESHNDSNDYLSIASHSDSESDWTAQYNSIYNVNSNSYDIFEPIELVTKIGKRTSQYYVILKSTGGGRS